MAWVAPVWVLIASQKAAQSDKQDLCLEWAVLVVQALLKQKQPKNQ